MNNLGVVIVDMQEFFLQHFDTSVRKQLIKNQIEFLSFCRKHRIPVVVTEYKCRNVFRGKIIPDIKKQLVNIEKAEVIKLHNSGFTNTELDKVLKNLGIRKIVLIGVNGNACVQDTAIGALHRKYKVLVSKGLVASAGRGDMTFSRRNESWFRENTVFFDNPEKLISYLEKDLHV